MRKLKLSLPLTFALLTGSAVGNWSPLVAQKLCPLFSGLQGCSSSVPSHTCSRMTTTTTTEGQVNKPHITFGILADVQYADVDDGTDYSKTRIRYYRNALNLLKNAVNDWKRSSDTVAFVLQLGDLIDGKAKKRKGMESSKQALRTALEPFESMRVPVYHIIGNHELYNLPRSYYLTSPLNCSLSQDIQPSTDHLYYTFLPHPKLRIVAIDTFEVGLLGYADDPDNEHYILAQELFTQHNKNKDINHSAGLEGLERRWVGYNGGVGQRQLRWLASVLEKATAKQENVILITHVPLLTEDRDYAVTLTWNYEEVLQVIHQFPCVLTVFAGHEHMGNHVIDDRGIHHITYPAILETRPGSDAYATGRLFSDHLSIAGVGRVPSYDLPLKYVF